MPHLIWYIVAALHMIFIIYEFAPAPEELAETKRLKSQDTNKTNAAKRANRLALLEIINERKNLWKGIQKLLLTPIAHWI